MNTDKFEWLVQWWPAPGAGTSSWAPLIATGLALIGLMLWWTRLRRSPPGAAALPDYDRSADQFAATAPMTEEQVRLLQYLQRAFPDGVVLFRPRLARFLTVRSTRLRRGAQQRLAASQVDYLVCSDDGKPLFAFEVDAGKAEPDPDLTRQSADKNAMLKSAGIRLVRLKGAAPQLPPPGVLRLRLLAAQRAPAPAAASASAAPRAQPSGFAGSGFGPPSDFVASRSAGHSGVMSLTGLMGLHGQGEDPWASVRKR